MPIGLNNVVDRGINVALSRRLGLGDTNVSLMPEIAPVIPIDAPEMAYHLGWRRYMTGGSIAAGGVGQNAILQFRLPNRSNIIAVVEGAFMFSTAGAATFLEMTIAMGLFATDLAIPFAGQPRDTRQPFNTGSLQVSGTTAAPVGGMLFHPSVPTFPLFPIILFSSVNATPQSLSLNGFTIQAVLGNQQADIGVLWRERILNEQEATI